MTARTEQFYVPCIAELESQLKHHDERIATLEKQVSELLTFNKTLVKKNAELTKQVTQLTDKIAQLSKNSSKSPSSDTHHYWDRSCHFVIYTYPHHVNGYFLWFNRVSASGRNSVCRYPFKLFLGIIAGYSENLMPYGAK